MKIATYNIWNSDTGMPDRENHIISEIVSLDADVVALQEVTDQRMGERIQEGTGFQYQSFSEYEGRVLEDEPWRISEGLTVFSRYPIKSVSYIEYALFAVIEHEGSTHLFVDVHLPWDSVIAKEKCVVDIMREIARISADYYFILGDFNCNESSSIHHYLKGYRSFNSTEVNPYWTDLAIVAEEFLEAKREMTLDLTNNARWKGKPITDHSDRVDCIFIRDCFPKPYPTLREFKYFGKQIYEGTGFCASDHYGVFADIQMPYEK